MSTVGSIAADFSGNPFPGVAQIGSALEWGSRGRWFDSSHSDQVNETRFSKNFIEKRVLFYV